MDIAAISQGDHGRVVCANAENVRGFRSKACPARIMRRFDPTGQRSFPHMESIGSRHNMVGQWGLRRVSDAIVSGSYSGGNCKSPGIRGKRRRTRKKCAGGTPFRGGNPGKTQLHRRQSVAKTGSNGPKAATMEISLAWSRAVPFLQTEFCPSPFCLNA